jgi:hypothetical protein
LIGGLDTASSLTTWLIHEPAPADDPVVLYEVTASTAAPLFTRNYLLFADQYIEQPRLWSPGGDAFVFAEDTANGSMVSVVAATADATPQVVGPGEVGFWSPAP